MRGDSGVASEERVVSMPPKFRSSLPGHEQISTQIGFPTLRLACVLLYWFILRGSFILHLGL